MKWTRLRKTNNDNNVPRINTSNQSTQVPNAALAQQYVPKCRIISETMVARRRPELPKTVAVVVNLP